MNYFSFGYFAGRLLPYEILSLSDTPIYLKSKPEKTNEPKIKNIILIMGESASASHFSVFGYDRNTSPFLNLLKNEKKQLLEKRIQEVYLQQYPCQCFLILSGSNECSKVAKGDTNLFNLAKDQGFQHFFTQLKLGTRCI